MDSTDGLFLILLIRFRYRPSAIFRAGILNSRINIKVGESYVQSVKGNTGAKVGTVEGCSVIEIISCSENAIQRIAPYYTLYGGVTRCLQHMHGAMYIADMLARPCHAFKRADTEEERVAWEL